MTDLDGLHNKLTRYALTYTGRPVYEYQGGDIDHRAHGAPTLTDIAVQCGRIARFVGATAIYYPVLLHLFVVRSVVEAMGGGPRAQLEALLHDAHEAITGDIPSPYKSSVMADFQRELDLRLYRTLRIREPSPQETQMVKDADRLVLLAEAHLIGPPGSDWVQEAGGADPDVVEIVQYVLEEYPAYADVLEANGRAVQDYLLLASSLVSNLEEEEEEN